MCELCFRTNCHSRCPNYKSKGLGIYCDQCGEEILVDEEYIENDFGNAMHVDCIPSLRELINWLGLAIKEQHE